MSAFCGFGLGFILSDVFRIPKYPVSKAIKSLGKRKNKQISRLEIWLGDFSNLIASKLRLNEYKRLQLKADLESADMTLSPEQYVGNAIVKSVLVAVLAIPFLFFAPLISLVMIIIAIAVYVGEYGKVGKIIREKRRKIEYELPRLVSSIDKTLIHSRDVLGILDSYREHAGEELRRELEITVADMRSGNYEVALTRLESRVGSSMMSDVTRGLISVIRGDKTDVYWGNLVLKFSDYQRTLLKTEANKAPKRVRKLSMALLFCFMLVYVVVIGQVLSGSAVLFGRDVRMKMIRSIFKNKRGESYVDVAITVMIVAFVLVFSVNIVSIVALNQNVKIMSDQIIDYATRNGTTDIGDYVKTLRENSGIDFACSFAGTDYLSGQKVQLGDVIRCKLTYRVSIFGFGDAVFPVTVQADSQGISQVYWK